MYPILDEMVQMERGGVNIIDLMGTISFAFATVPSPSPVTVNSVMW